MRRVLILAAIGPLLLLAGATPILAHAPSEASPRPGATVGGLVDRVVLAYPEQMVESGLWVQVSDAAGGEVPGVTRLSGDRRLVIHEFEPLTDAGPHRVDYSVTGEDGVTWPGAYIFVFDPAAAPPGAVDELLGGEPGWTTPALGVSGLIALALFVIVRRWRAGRASESG